MNCDKQGSRRITQLSMICWNPKFENSYKKKTISEILEWESIAAMVGHHDLLGQYNVPKNIFYQLLWTSWS